MLCSQWPGSDNNSDYIDSLKPIWPYWPISCEKISRVMTSVCAQHYLLKRAKMYFSDKISYSFRKKSVLARHWLERLRSIHNLDIRMSITFGLFFREIPRELLRLNRGGEVHVNMVDKRHEEYIKPKETIRAFSGEGHKLGRWESLWEDYRELGSPEQRYQAWGLQEASRVRLDHNVLRFSFTIQCQTSLLLLKAVLM